MGRGWEQAGRLLEASKYAFFRPSGQPSSPDFRGDCCHKLLLLSTQFVRACMQAGGLNVCIFRPSRQRLSADSRGDFCQKLLHLSMQVCRACMQVCSACMQASRQAPLQHLSSTSGPKSQILGVIPVRICLFWAPRSSDACMQAGRQAPLQNQAGTSPEPCRPGERWQKGNFREGVEARF